MKKTLLAITILFSLSASAQNNYNDSLITLTLTQRFANYVGQYVRISVTGDEVWKNRATLDVLKPFIGSGAANKKDSLFTVMLNAKFVIGALDRLMSHPSFKTSDDMNRILYNTPAVSGYTALATQVVNIAAGNSSQKHTAQFIVDWFNNRVNAMVADRDADYANTVTWGRL